MDLPGYFSFPAGRQVDISHYVTASGHRATPGSHRSGCGITGTLCILRFLKGSVIVVYGCQNPQRPGNTQ